MDISNLDEADIKELALQQVALRCKTDLFFLDKEILGFSKMTKGTHQDLCDYTTSVLPNPPEITLEGFDPRKNLLLLLMPRGTFKTSVVTIGLTLQFFLQEPDGRVLLDSETFAKSKAFLREIKWHLESNEKYREIFKAIHGVYPFETKNKAILWTDSELILPCRKRSRKEPSISCAGIDRSINGMHYDLIIGDDLHSEKNVTNKEQIQQVIDHFKLCFSLLDPGKPLIIIGTRWDYSDLYQHIIDFRQNSFNVLKRSAYNPDGSLFFPEVLSEKELNNIREIQGSSIFSKQYLNEPVSDENATFKRDKIIRKPWDEVKNRPINWYLSVDPSYEGTYSDFAALVVAGMDFQRDLYVKHVVRKKMTYGEIINEVFRLFTESDVRIQKILIETVATQKSIGIELANEQKRRNTWLPIQEIRSRQQSKEERIRGLAPFYEFNHIFHVKECPQIDELEYELLHFPTGRHDDVVDALANILEIASPPTNKSAAYEREKRRNNPLAWKPQSSITGY